MRKKVADKDGTSPRHPEHLWEYGGSDSVGRFSWRKCVCGAMERHGYAGWEELK